MEQLELFREETQVEANVIDLRTRRRHVRRIKREALGVAPDPCAPQSIAALEKLLLAAKAGTLRGLGIVALMDDAEDDTWQFYLCDETASRHMVLTSIGAIEKLKDYAMTLARAADDDLDVEDFTE